MALIHRACVLAAVFGFGCGTEFLYEPPQPLLQGFEVPDAPDPAIGMRIVTPPVLGLTAGSNHEICSWTGIQVDHTMDIRKAIGYQHIIGHHIILFASKTNLGGQRECTDADMASFRQVAATGNEGLPSEAPGELVYRVEAGMYLVLQEHYINATDATVDSQSVLDLFYAEPDKNYIPSHSIAFLNTVLDLKPGPNTVDVHCKMQTDVDGWFSLPHMHEWGTKFTATITSGTVADTVFDVPTWHANYAFSPPSFQYPITAPKHLLKDDTVDVHCEWNNTTPNDLHFGQEMCVFYLQTIDRTGMGNLDCNDGVWDTF